MYSLPYGSPQRRINNDFFKNKIKNALRSNNSFNVTPPLDEEFSNQCLFIRMLNATLNNKEWKALYNNLDLANVLDASPSSCTIFPETPLHSQRNT
jgi:hypothetical protein